MAFIIVVSGFMAVGETMTVTAQDYINQTNSTKSDKQKIIVIGGNHISCIWPGMADLLLWSYYWF